MKTKSITKTVYHVHLPYPNNKMFGMVKCNGQPFFLASSIAKALSMDSKKVVEIASPNISTIMSTKVVSLYGYWKDTLLGTTKTCRNFQHVFIHTALNHLYQDSIKKYIEIVQKSDNNAKGKRIKTTKESFY